MNAKCSLAVHHLTRILERYSVAYEIKEWVRENEMNCNHEIINCIINYKITNDRDNIAA